MGLFQDTKYFLANSIPPHRQEQLEYALSKNGATKAPSITAATHVITNSPFFEGCEGVEANAAIVSDYWVDRSLVLGKIQPPQYYSVDPAMLFSGIVACATELPTADLEVLSAGITALGGQWRTGLTNDVTHLFAVNTNSQKYTTALAHRASTGIRILLPHWFDDSVRLGIRNLPVESYLWPDPPYLKQIGIHDVSALEAGKDKGDKQENKAKKNMMATANIFTPAADSSIPIPKDVDLMPVKKGVWNGKKILLSWTLSLYGSRREAVEAGIRRAGGEVLRYPGDDDDDLDTEEKEIRRDKKEARAVVECDILITRWRSGRAYGKAFRLHRTIGTLAWMYHVQSTGHTPRPVDQLLHYPIPRKPIEGFSAHEITVTNYTGESREYIKRLISALGATFTPSMTGRNTILIAAYIHGIKAEKARAWSIPVVNHTWLEDCFIQWRLLTPATEKYIIFPQGVDFSKLLGERGVGVRGVELCEEEEGKEGESSEEEGMDVDAMEPGVHAGPVVDVDDGDDKVLKTGVGDDIDIISMPGTDDPGNDSTFYHDPPTTNKSPAKLYGRTKSDREISESVSPAKLRRDSSHTSPSKRAAPLTNVTPAKSKPTSPTKRRKIVVDDDEDEDEARMDVERADEPEQDKVVNVNRKKAIRTRKSAPVDVDEKEEEAEAEPVTPSKKANRTKTVVGSMKKRKMAISEPESLPDLELSDDDDVLDRTPDFYKSSAKSKSKYGGTKEKAGEEEEESEEERRVGNDVKGKERRRSDSEEEEEEERMVSNAKKPASGKRGSSRRINLEEGDGDEDELPAPPPAKKRLVRRLTKESSLQLAQEREEEREKEKERERRSESSSAPRKLVRRASGKVATPYVELEQRKGAEKENATRAQVEKTTDKEDAGAPKVGLLKTTRGDARTRVKAKSAKAKARELYSDSEDEVVGIVEAKAEKGTDKGKGKGKEKTQREARAKARGGRKARRVSSSEEEAMPVESEDEDDEDDHRGVSAKEPTSTPSKPARISPLSYKVSVVVNPPPSVRSSAKAKGKDKAIDVDSGASSPSDDNDDESPRKPVSPRRGPTRQVKKTESIHVEAGEKAAASTSRSKPISSPVKLSSTSAKSKPKPRPQHASSTSKPAVPPTSSPLSTIHTPNTDISEPPAKRGAAAKAEQKLKVMMPDATKFEQEMRKARKSGGPGLKGIGMGTWEQEEKEKEATSVTASTSGRKKRSSDAMDVDTEVEAEKKKKRRTSTNVKEEKENESEKTEGEEAEAVVSVSKTKEKGKKRESDQGIRTNKIYVMTTQATLPDNVVKSLEKLGVVITTKPSQCTHLIAPHLVRTEKFLCALAAAPHILEASWAVKSAAAKQLLPESQFLLRDQAAEAKYKTRLSEALARAKGLKGTLFAQKTFYITPKTKVDFKLLKSVVTAHGGQLLQQSPTIRMLNGHPDRHVISCPEDISIWRPLAAQNIPIYTHEFLLIGVLKQELEWDNPAFKVEGSH